MNSLLLTLIIIISILFSVCLVLCILNFSDLILYCCKCKCCNGDYEAIPTADY